MIRQSKNSKQKPNSQIPKLTGRQEQIFEVVRAGDLEKLKSFKLTKEDFLVNENNKSLIQSAILQLDSARNMIDYLFNQEYQLCVQPTDALPPEEPYPFASAPAYNPAPAHAPAQAYAPAPTYYSHKRLFDMVKNNNNKDLKKFETLIPFLGERELTMRDRDGMCFLDYACQHKGAIYERVRQLLVARKNQIDSAKQLNYPYSYAVSYGQYPAYYQYPNMYAPMPGYAFPPMPMAYIPSQPVNESATTEQQNDEANAETPVIHAPVAVSPAIGQQAQQLLNASAENLEAAIFKKQAAALKKPHPSSAAPVAEKSQPKTTSVGNKRQVPHQQKTLPRKENKKPVEQINTASLLSAVSRGNVDLVQTILSRNPNLINTTLKEEPFNGKTALYLAMVRRNLDMVKALLAITSPEKAAAYANDDDQENKGKSEVGLAVALNSPEILMALLEHGYPSSEKCIDQALNHKKDVECLIILINFLVDNQLTSRTRERSKAINNAIELNHLPALKRLFSPKLGYELFLKIALEKTGKDSILFLIKHITNRHCLSDTHIQNLVCKLDSELVEAILAKEMSLHNPSVKSSGLFYAISQGYTSIVQYYYKKNLPDITTQSAEGLTPLQHAVLQDSKASKETLIVLLRYACVNVDTVAVNPARSEFKGLNALGIAIVEDNLEAVDSLLVRSNKKGLLQLAVKLNKLGSVRKLLTVTDEDALWVKDEQGKTVFVIAAEQGYQYTLEALLSSLDKDKKISVLEELLSLDSLQPLMSDFLKQYQANLNPVKKQVKPVKEQVKQVKEEVSEANNSYKSALLNNHRANLPTVDGVNEICLEIDKDNLNRVKELLTSELVNRLNNENQSPFIHALKMKKMDIVEYILEHPGLNLYDPHCIIKNEGKEEELNGFQVFIKCYEDNNFYKPLLSKFVAHWRITTKNELKETRFNLIKYAVDVSKFDLAFDLAIGHIPDELNTVITRIDHTTLNYLMLHVVITPFDFDKVTELLKIAKEYNVNLNHQVNNRNHEYNDGFTLLHSLIYHLNQNNHDRVLRIICSFVWAVRDAHLFKDAEGKTPLELFINKQPRIKPDNYWVYLCFLNNIIVKNISNPRFIIDELLAVQRIDEGNATVVPLLEYLLTKNLIFLAEFVIHHLELYEELSKQPTSLDKIWLLAPEKKSLRIINALLAYPIPLYVNPKEELRTYINYRQSSMGEMEKEVIERAIDNIALIDGIHVLKLLKELFPKADEEYKLPSGKTLLEQAFETDRLPQIKNYYRKKYFSSCSKEAKVGRLTFFVQNYPAIIREKQDDQPGLLLIRDTLKGNPTALAQAQKTYAEGLMKLNEFSRK